MRFIYNLLIILALPFVLGTSTTNQPKFVTESYCNARYGFCVDYTNDILDQEKIADNGDGIFLNASTQPVEVVIAGSFNVFNFDINALTENTLANLGLTTETVNPAHLNITNNQLELLVESPEFLTYKKIYLLNDIYVEVIIKVPAEEQELLQKLKEEIVVDLML